MNNTQEILQNYVNNNLGELYSIIIESKKYPKYGYSIVKISIILLSKILWIID